MIRLRTGHWKTLRGLFLTLCLIATSVSLAKAGDEMMAPNITSQTTFFYYHDLDTAAAFYENVLALPKTLDLGWVKIYAIGPAATVGLVGKGRGAHKPADTKPVMLSIVTDEIDQWFRFLKDKNVKFERELAPENTGDSSGAPVRSFLIVDPEGYNIEFYQWLEPPE